MQAILLGLFVVATLFLVFRTWSSFNRSSAAKSRYGTRKRKSDRIRLSGSQKKIYKQARKQFQEGNIKASAQLLESLGMTRDAINLLESAKMINEAAAILLRIGRPNRAGIVYARAKKWKEAAECFKKANMPMEVGKCYKELGDPATAISYFIEAEEFEKAADSYIELGRHQEAAKLYSKLSQHERAAESYQSLIDSNSDPHSLRLDDNEVKTISNYLSRGMVDTRFADVPKIKSELCSIIVKLIKNKDEKNALKIYLRNSGDIGPELIGNKQLSDDDFAMVAQIFNDASNYEYSGMVYERLNNFKKAGEAFNKAEDYERALYCYERGGFSKEAQEMRISLATHGKKTSESAPVGEKKEGKKKDENQAFAIGNLTQAENYSGEDKTQVFGGTPSASDIPDPAAAHLNQESQPPASVQQIVIQAPQLATNKMRDKKDHDWTPFLNSELLKDLTSSQKELIKDIGNTRKYDPDQVILDYEKEPAGLYFVLEGKISCHKIRNNKDVKVDEIHSGGTFGELWLLIDMASQVKFVANSTSYVHSIPRADFLDLLDKNGTIARKLYKRFTKKLLEKLLNHENNTTNLSAS